MHRPKTIFNQITGLIDETEMLFKWEGGDAKCMCIVVNVWFAQISGNKGLAQCHFEPVFQCRHTYAHTQKKKKL